MAFFYSDMFRVFAFKMSNYMFRFATADSFQTLTTGMLIFLLFNMSLGLDLRILESRLGISDIRGLSPDPVQ
jgi:hypothetical protein